MVTFARRLLFSAAVIGVILVSIEAGSWFLLRSLSDVELDSRLHGLPSAPRTDAAAREAVVDVQTREVIHPYLGFVERPSQSVIDRPLSLDALGFAGGGPWVHDAKPDQFVVGVFGGSVAWLFATGGGTDRVFAGLGGVPELAGRHLVGTSAAVAGYKQPQSLLALAYLLSLGTHFDLVILLDGFNEVALPIRDNVFTGVFPFFPRSWGQRVANLDLATGTRALIGELAYLNERRGAWASWLADSPLRSSNTATLLWILFDRRLESRIVQTRASLGERRTAEPFDYLATGPHWPSAASPALYDDLALMWKRSALAMHALCKENGIPFFVFLQPNQYLPESKPMGPEERSVALLDTQPFAESVRAGYPLLRRAGEELRTRGVHFVDLTQIFAEVREPIYIDNCCHVGPRGNEILADAMSAAIAASMREDAKARAGDLPPAG